MHRKKTPKIHGGLSLSIQQTPDPCRHVKRLSKARERVTQKVEREQHTAFIQTGKKSYSQA